MGSLRRGFPLGPLIRTSTLALALTFMPEALRLMSRSPLSPFGISALAAPTDGAVTHEIRLDGMSCEACEVYVQQVLQWQSGIVGVTHTDYEAGIVHVVGNPSYDLTSQRPNGYWRRTDMRHSVQGSSIEAVGRTTDSLSSYRAHSTDDGSCSSTAVQVHSYKSFITYKCTCASLCVASLVQACRSQHTSLHKGHA